MLEKYYSYLCYFENISTAPIHLKGKVKKIRQIRNYLIFANKYKTKL